jgi:hypothetical protein
MSTFITSNIDKKWLLEEDKLLCRLVIENKAYEDIAIQLKRDKESIISRVMDKIIFPEYNSENIKELAEKYKIDNINYLQKCMLYNMKKTEYYNKKREEYRLNINNKCYELLYDILEKLEIIEEKLERIERKINNYSGNK